MKIAMLKQRNDGIAVGGLCGRSGLACSRLALIQAVAIFSSCSKGGKSCEVFRDSAVRWTVGSRNLRSGADRPYGKRLGVFATDQEERSIGTWSPIWNKLDALHLNTLIGTVNWELLEPEECKFNFTLVDAKSKRRRRGICVWYSSGLSPGRMAIPLTLLYG